MWSFSRLFVKTSAGRRRFNVLAALNAITHELVMITNDTYITADSVCDLLRGIAKLNLGVPITLVLDNARYQKCNMVTALALRVQPSHDVLIRSILPRTDRSSARTALSLRRSAARRVD